MGQLRSARPLGTRVALVALAFGIGAACVACSSGSSGHGVSLGSGASTAAAGGVTPGASTPATTGSGGGAVPTSSPGNPGPASVGPGTTAAHGTGTTAATAPAGPAATGTTAPRVTTAPATGPAPTPTGSYHYNLVSGTSVLTTGTTATTLSVAPQSTLVVSSTGSGTQQWVNSSATTNLVFNGSGVFLVSETIPLASTTCTFSAPMPSPPWPLAVGRSFSGQATCGSGSSASILTLQGRVSATAAVAIGGTSVATYLVQSTLSLNGTSLVIAETDWYAPSLRLPVKTTVIAQGGVPGYAINSNTTYQLSSVSPS